MSVLEFNGSQSRSRHDAIQPYVMHVSARYLELTRKKLELTRLPREYPTTAPPWANGTPKSVLEPLLDYWLEQYDWRVQEASLNHRLPQFRYSIDNAASNTTDDAAATSAPAPQPFRIHFVHKRCQGVKAVPLLYCHGWPGSFLEVSKLIDGLSEPYFATMSPNSEQPLGFHVVAPSVPGCGFSDAPPTGDFGLEKTADYFNALMGQLGYTRYVAHGSGLGFAVCRMLSLRHGANCVAVHTVSPQVPAPKLRQSYAAMLKYQAAYLTNARYATLAFGYTPSDISSASQSGSNPQGFDVEHYARYAVRPQTHAFSLTDSPAALLASMLDILQPHDLHIPPKPPPAQVRPQKPPSASSSRSSSMDNVRRTAADPFLESIRESIESGLSLLQLTRPQMPAWSPIDVLNWTMMVWLPGPEGGLQWLNRAIRESAFDDKGLLWADYSSVPLGITTFRKPEGPHTDHGNEPEIQNSTADPEAAVRPRPPSSRSWWAKLWPMHTQSKGAESPSKRSTPSTEHARSGSPPQWAAAYQRLEWVRRHETQTRTPVWEESDQLVADLREYFGDLQMRGLIQMLDV